jgi:hypothetical protein
MFPPGPPRDEDPSPPSRGDLDPDDGLTLPGFGHAGRWPALGRLSWLCRILALPSLVLGVVWACATVYYALFPIERFSLYYPPEPHSPVPGLFAALCIFLGSIVGYYFWVGLAEAILVFLAIERNTRQTRRRLHQRAQSGSPYEDNDY